jgi:hypothetical protein
MILKLHYLVAPKWMPHEMVNLYRAIHAKYNATLRMLFLKSQEDTAGPNRMSSVISLIINGGTKFYVLLFLGLKWLYGVRN